MRKLTYIAACAALTVSVLTGCTVSSTATQESSAETEQTENSVETNTEKETYQSKHGWSVSYDPEQFNVNESGDDVSFVYAGESAGSSMVTISYIGAKQPEEVLYDVTSQWGDMENISRLEGIFPGTEDKWGYWRVINPEAEGSGLSETAIAGEYNGGVLLFDITVHVCGDDAIDIPVSDALSELVNTVQYENFEPQKMYEHVPGRYVQEFSEEIEGQEETAEYSITLNDDHTGTLSIQDDVDIIWESYELKAADGSFAYEYTLEGDELLVNYDGNWISFVKESAAEGHSEKDIYAGLWAEKSAERMVLQISPVDEEGWYDIEITWRDDLPQKDVYDMRAHLQEDGSLYYDNCRYVIRTFEGEDFTDDIQYQSGSGLLYYDEDAEELYWTDYEVDPEENVTTFIRADFSEDEENGENEVQDIMSYMSPDNWVAHYNPEYIYAKEIDEHTAVFVYTGEEDGPNELTISYIADKAPEEVMREKTSEWDQDRVIANAGQFRDTGYEQIYMMLMPKEEGKGAAASCTAIDYNAGTLLLETKDFLSGDDEKDIAMSDAIADIFDSLELKDLDN